MKVRINIWFGVLLSAVSGTSRNFEGEEVADLNQTFFISEIFDKYGNNNIMTYEGFEHLLENLGLGKLRFETKHDVSIHKVNGTFREFHDELALHKHYHNSDGSDKEEASEGGNAARRKRNLRAEENVVKTLGRKCLTAQDILLTYGLKPHHDVVISPSKYLQMCPAIVYELDQKLCQGEEAREISFSQEEGHLVWICASASIFVMGVSGMLCVLLIPLIRKDCRSPFLQFLVSLAVSTLCGDALIHLIPQIFSLTEKPGSDMTVFLRGTVILLAIYFFFIVENILKDLRGKQEKNVEDSKESKAMITSFESHGHCHSQGSGKIETVAWMAILGDILHNVTDGLSIGAAFKTSLSSGFASSVAVFCHELPHELGDYAILLASGMSIKKSLFYNFVSSIFSLVGMTAGILLGEIDDASLWINAFTAGSFLYISLSDLVPEMKMMRTNSTVKNFIVQTIGLACGGLLMFIIAFYEDQIENFFGQKQESIIFL